MGGPVTRAVSTNPIKTSLAFLTTAPFSDFKNPEFSAFRLLPLGRDAFAAATQQEAEVCTLS
jgi:hypothetical protein